MERKRKTRRIRYIPARYILAMLITVLEVVGIIGAVIALCYYFRFFYLAAIATHVLCVVKIVSSDDNPDYKVPWLLTVMGLPVVGFMLYFLFYSRSFKRKFLRRLEELQTRGYEYDDTRATAALAREGAPIEGDLRMLCRIADTHLFQNTATTYFPLGEDLHRAMLADLRAAEHFIFMEYFIIERGVFWDSILEILREKARAGVTVKILYDDVGCMKTLPGNYTRVLARDGIECLPFSRLRGNADSEFNNRNHRKITVIDGRVGFTGGVNLADEYINARVRFGHWKDTGLRLEGAAVYELTRLFLLDFGVSKRKTELPELALYPDFSDVVGSGYVVPFGDGPRPLYRHRVTKSAIRNLLASARRYVYMTTPYLIIDNDLCTCIENAAMRGVDVRIILPHIPDKRLIFEITQSYYARLLSAGVGIYEYTPGFIHAKSYLCDDSVAIVGTVNLDYRSLVHHFENGVLLYRCDAIADLKADLCATLAASEQIPRASSRPRLWRRMLRATLRVFAPLM
ncbi:MAG: cardiolipin synthase [Clostridia bacterium]|nr:cardiolipin synthase [Clostridia bacterium]